MKTKAFTLVELIVVITILAILGTIAFISLSGYSKEARDSKRITDTSSLLSKINIEEVRGRNISELITNTKTGSLKILGKADSEVQTFGEANFKNLKEDEKNFRDPRNKSQNYPMAYAIGGSGKDAYKFIQIASVSEKENKNIIKGNYYKLEEEDDESLFSSGGIIYTEDKAPLVYELEGVNPKEEGEGTLGADCKGGTEDGYVLEDTKNGEEITVTKTGSIINNGTLSATKTFLCENQNFIGKEVVVNDITCNNYYYPEKDECKYFKPNEMNDPNNIGTLRLVDGKLGTQDSYYLDSVTGLAWKKRDGKDDYAWATSNAHQQPIWNGTEYSYPSGPESEYPAFEYCRSLGSKWRIPTTKELVTLVTFKGFNENGGQSIHPDIKSTTLVSSLEKHFYKDNPEELDKSLYINFLIGDIHYSSKNTARTILCVHDLGKVGNGIKWIRDDNKKDGRYEEIVNLNGTGAIKDNNTGKYWTKLTIGEHQYSDNMNNPEPTWNGTGYDYTNGLTAKNYPAFEICTGIGKGWRMPTYYELLTLVDYENRNSSGLTTSLEHIKLNGHWSSTKLISNTHKHQAFYLAFSDGTSAHSTDAGIESEKNIICIHD